MTSGLVANFRKAITGESIELVDSFVFVSFAGHSVSGVNSWAIQNVIIDGK